MKWGLISWLNTVASYYCTCSRIFNVDSTCNILEHKQLDIIEKIFAIAWKLLCLLPNDVHSVSFWGVVWTKKWGFPSSASSRNHKAVANLKNMPQRLSFVHAHFSSLNNANGMNTTLVIFLFCRGTISNTTDNVHTHQKKCIKTHSPIWALLEGRLNNTINKLPAS